MRAGTVTLRIDDLLVGIGADSVDTIELVRSRFAEFVDGGHPDVTPAFDLFLPVGAGRGIRSVPQLRRGRVVVARSRSAAAVIEALDSILGGIRAQRTAPDEVWTFLRPFAAADRVALVDARAPMLVNDLMLEQVGIVELPVWAVALVAPDGPDTSAVELEVPSALTDPAGSGGRFELAGLVLVGPSEQEPLGDVVARYAARHTSPTWFRTITAQFDGGRAALVADRVTARHAIARTLGPG